MAVGMACAGTGQKDAVALLEPLLLDSVDFVRQPCAHTGGPGIATALVMNQQLWDGHGLSYAWASYGDMRACACAQTPALPPH
eukprot:1139475-Pelagomonas_calceolata.AAC.7